MVEIKHPDERVAVAFNLRLHGNLHSGEWQDMHTINKYKPGGDHLCATISRIEYPAWHPMHGVSALRVSMYGTGDWTGQEKSVEMRRLVRGYLGLKQGEFEWLMVRIGGRDPHFRHTWDIFTENELRGAVQYR